MAANAPGIYRCRLVQAYRLIVLKHPESTPCFKLLEIDSVVLHVCSVNPRQPVAGYVSSFAVVSNVFDSLELFEIFGS